VQVRRDGVQVLVELTGQTANNRLGVMATQPAPVQLTWIGYPNSTGLPAVHYRLTGHVTTETCTIAVQQTLAAILAIPVAFSTVDGVANTARVL